MLGTVLQCGSFTADGTDKYLNLRSDVDWMWVWNQTVLDAAGAGTGAQFYWQRGMTDDTGVIYLKTAATNALQIDMMTSAGFSLFDDSSNPVQAAVSVTAVSNASPPRVTAASHGLQTGDVARMIDITGAQQLGGLDFTVTRIDANNFDLAYMATVVAGTTGSFRKISHQPLFSPRRRFITAITKAASAVITLSVTHDFTAGQAVRVRVPAAYGMTEINDIIGNITAVSTANNTITVDIDSTAFTTFAFPLTAATPFTKAEVIPVGETANATYQNNLDDAMDNVGNIGMILKAGTSSPAGATSDVIYWSAGKCFSVNNE